MISVIIPNYDSLKTILDILDSIYTTDFKDFEVIVVNPFSNSFNNEDLFI